MTRNQGRGRPWLLMLPQFVVMGAFIAVYLSIGGGLDAPNYGDPLLLVQSIGWFFLPVIAVVSLFSLFLGNRYIRRLPARRALAVAEYDTVLGISLLGLFVLGASARYGWIETVAEIGAGAYLLFDLSTWPRRRARAGKLIVRVRQPWWLVPSFAYIALSFVWFYIAVEFLGAGISFVGSVVAVLIVVAALEMFFEALAGTELRDRGVLFFSRLVPWSEIIGYEFEDKHSAGKSLHNWSFWLHLYVRRYPPLSRMFLNMSFAEKRIGAPMSSKEDRDQLEVVLRERAYLDHGHPPATSW